MEKILKPICIKKPIRKDDYMHNCKQFMVNSFVVKNQLKFKSMKLYFYKKHIPTRHLLRRLEEFGIKKVMNSIYKNLTPEREQHMKEVNEYLRQELTRKTEETDNYILTTKASRKPRIVSKKTRANQILSHAYDNYKSGRISLETYLEKLEELRHDIIVED